MKFNFKFNNWMIKNNQGLFATIGSWRRQHAAITTLSRNNIGPLFWNPSRHSPPNANGSYISRCRRLVFESQPRLPQHTFLQIRPCSTLLRAPHNWRALHEASLPNRISSTYVPNSRPDFLRSNAWAWPGLTASKAKSGKRVRNFIFLVGWCIYWLERPAFGWSLP